MDNDTLLLRTNALPTYLNTEMKIGAGLAGLAAMIALPVAAFSTTAFLVGIGGIFAGAAVGGLIGKERMEKETRDGKVVHKDYQPLNKDTLIGALRLAISGALVGIIAAPLGFAVGALMPAVIGAVIGGGIGAVMGAEKSRVLHHMEFEAATRQMVANHISQNISPQMGQAVEYAVSHDKNWMQDMAEERLLQQAQNQQIH